MHWLFQCRSFAWTPKRNPQYLEHQRQQQHYQLQHKHQQNERHDNLSCYIQQPTPHHSSSQKKVRLSVSSSDNVACLDFSRGHRGLLCLRYSPTKSSEGSSLHYAVIPMWMGQLGIWVWIPLLPPFSCNSIISEKIFGLSFRFSFTFCTYL